MCNEAYLAQFFASSHFTLKKLAEALKKQQIAGGFLLGNFSLRDGLLFDRKSDEAQQLKDPQSQLYRALKHECLAFGNLIERSTQDLTDTHTQLKLKPLSWIRVFLMGDPRVGKTTIFKRYLLEEPFSSEYVKHKADDWTNKCKRCKFGAGSAEVSVSMSTREGSNKSWSVSGHNAYIIVVASDSRASFDNIDEWRDYIRDNGTKHEPLSLLLVQKSDSDQEVTEAMVREKSQDGHYEGYAVINNDRMPYDQYCDTINEEIAKLYAKAFKNCVDAKALLAYGLVHCQPEA